MKKSKKIQIGESEYAAGRTELSHEQKSLLESISKSLYDNYNNLTLNYAPEGLIAILRNQVKTKLENGTITEFESKEVTAMIDFFKIKLMQDSQ